MLVRVLLASVVALIGVVGCASAPAANGDPFAGLAAYNVQVISEGSGETTLLSVDGYITQTGEFRLYRRRQDVGSDRSGICLSGTFLDRETRARAATFEGRKVRVVATYGLWSDVVNDPRVLSSPVQNYCGGRIVLYGRTIEPLDE